MMNQTMNDMFKKDLPNLHEWCEDYAKKTGIKIYAGNPPLAQVVEDLMGKVNALAIAMGNHAKKMNEIIERLEPQVEAPKKEKAKK